MTTIPALPTVTQATPAEVGTVARLVAEAFFPLCASQWLVPDPERRCDALAGQFVILVEHALAWGQVDLLADGTGTAVWFHRAQPIPPPTDYDRRLVAACGDLTDRFRMLDALFDEHHPDEPHHHLAMLAVTEQHQGTGRGGLLLRHHHAVLDAQGMPAYLEAAGLRSASLYTREGYRPFAEPFALPNDAVFYPMWRIPAQRRPDVPETLTPPRRSRVPPVMTR